ncbi:unnamed protein product [Closterium sp. Yama58-4]|nr:unnamed protein product [Closterium sp. Yama58-4]
MSPSTASDPAATPRGPWQRDGQGHVDAKDAVLKEVDLSHMTSCAPRVKDAADYEREEDAYWAAESPMAAALASSNPPVQPDYKEALYDLANHSWRQLGDVHVISEGDDVRASDEKPVVARAPIQGAMAAGFARLDGLGDPEPWVWGEAQARASDGAALERSASVGGASRNTVQCGATIRSCIQHHPPVLHERRSSGDFSLFHFPVLPRESAPVHEAPPVASNACPRSHTAWTGTGPAGGGENEYRLFSRSSKGGRPGMAAVRMGRAGGEGFGGLSVPVM